MIGKVYEKLTVLSLSSNRSASGGKRYLCKCMCGTVKEYDGYLIRSGNTKSCGCLEPNRWVKHTNLEKMDKRNNRPRKEGLELFLSLYRSGLNIFECQKRADYNMALAYRYAREDMFELKEQRRREAFKNRPIKSAPKLVKKETLEKHVSIIEYFVCNPNLTGQEIAKVFGVSHTTVSYAINKYFEKPKNNLTLQSKINVN